LQHHSPSSEEEAAAIVRDAAARGARLAVEGGGTRSGLQRHNAETDRIATRGLAGVTLHEPSEMVISARAGTPLAMIETVLAEHGQHLPFEPMDHRAVYGTIGEPTIGAVAAGNISGPRRIQAGAARDSLIGLRFINGKGDLHRAGGRVMKNVTGLDLVKLQAGALGRLGLLTEATFKVLPRPRAATTLVLTGLKDDRAIEALAAALGSPFDVSGAAHRPGELGSVGQTFIRIENNPDSVDYRFGALANLLLPFGPVDRMDGQEHDRLWRDIRDVRDLADDPDAVIWRVSVKPSDGPLLVAELAAHRSVRALYDWGGGLVWLATGPDADAGALPLRALLTQLGGHARLERAPADLRARLGLLHPSSEAIRRLEDGIARALDPAGVFAAGGR
jgi:glycolate oxidase FAD binding subunit